MNLIECLTGFKYIGQQILKFETTGVGTYLFGFEESYGCLIGTHARDKDAIVATMALCEAAAYYKSKGMNLWDAMVDMYERYGYYKDEIVDLATGETKPTGLPSSNVLYYDMTDDAWLCVRPSGTEPKIKFYYGIKGTSLADADEKSEALGKAVLAMIDSMM